LVAPRFEAGARKRCRLAGCIRATPSAVYLDERAVSSRIPQMIRLTCLFLYETRDEPFGLPIVTEQHEADGA
jgi:hypothetical protein